MKKKEYLYGKFPYRMIEVEIYHTGRYGAPGEKRAPARKPTPEQMKKQNHRNKVKRILRYLRANFQKNDYYLTITYRKGDRPGEEAAKGHMARMVRRLRAWYKKQGEALKYLYCIETSTRGAVHIHMVMNRIRDADVAVAERWAYGHIHTELLYESGGFQKLAEYLGKEGKYTHSRNLALPRERAREIGAREWKKQPKAYKGYYIEKESVVSGCNPVTGKQYIHYTLIRFRRD